MLDIQLKWIRLDQLDPLRLDSSSTGDDWGLSDLSENQWILRMLEPHLVPLVTIHGWIEVSHGVTVGIAWAPYRKPRHACPSGTDRSIAASGAGEHGRTNRRIRPEMISFCACFLFETVEGQKIWKLEART